MKLSHSFFCLLLLISQNVLAQRYSKGNFELRLNFEKLAVKPTKIILSFTDSKNKSEDSVNVKGNSTVIHGQLSEPVHATLILKPLKGSYDTDGKKQIKGFPPKPVNQFKFFLDSGRVSIIVTEPLVNSKITGSKANVEYALLENEVTPINNRKDSLYIAYIRADSLKNADAIRQIESYLVVADQERRSIYRNHLMQHPKSLIVGLALARAISPNTKMAELQPLLDKMPPDVLRSYSVQTLVMRISTRENTSPGSVIKEFTLPDPTGKQVSITSFRGKYTLIDFWASWCGPCRTENVNLVKVYASYQKKGFEILSVSFDRPNAKANWLNAIKKDQLTWTNVSDLKFMDSPVAKQFGISDLPFNMLIDRDGKIIGKNLRGESLEARLSEIFK